MARKLQLFGKFPSGSSEPSANTVKSVNGVTPDANGNVEVEVSSDAVSYNRQELTEEQQMQARSNQGLPYHTETSTLTRVFSTSDTINVNTDEPIQVPNDDGYKLLYGTYYKMTLFNSSASYTFNGTSTVNIDYGPYINFVSEDGSMQCTLKQDQFSSGTNNLYITGLTGLSNGSWWNVELFIYITNRTVHNPLNPMYLIGSSLDSAANNKLIKVTGGGTAFDLVDPPTCELPEVSTDDNGKFLRVVDGAWAATSLPSAEEANF